MSKKQMDLFEIPTELPKPERKKLPRKPRELTWRERIEEAREKRAAERERRQLAAQQAKAKRPTLNQLEKELERARRQRSTLRIWRNVLAVLLPAVLILLFCFPMVRMQGSDMRNTLYKADLLLAVRTKDVQRGDVVLFSVGGGQQMVRRVIGLPGDEVYISPEGILMINGSFVQEDYVDFLIGSEPVLEFLMVVPEGKLFVLSDNRTSSLDSRYDFPGMIAQEQLIGKVLLRLLPIARAGIVQ